MARLAGKTAFITGAGIGIGRASALLFAAEGAKVAIAEINPEAGAETERLAKDAGGQALFIETDVTDAGSVKASLDRVDAEFGGLDILYNNAGGATPADGPVTETADEEFWRAISLDLFGTFLVCKHGIPKLIARGGGVVINTTSNVALKALPGRDCYTAAKGGVAAITRSMAAQYAPQKIRVNALAPGAVRTERVAKMLDNDPNIQAVVDRHILGIAEPEDIARAALYLATEDSAMMTGQILSVDSGMTIV
jgi:NAD(P)-dependent dehydrogenase (short-subunit alcohol dehydrogenase family)